jgi:hypothetical protein
MVGDRKLQSDRHRRVNLLTPTTCCEMARDPKVGRAEAAERRSMLTSQWGRRRTQLERLYEAWRQGAQRASLRSRCWRLRGQIYKDALRPNRTTWSILRHQCP